MSIGADELPRRIVLCEGIHDTAFWGAALKRLGCSKDARDPVSGSLGFASKTGAFIRLFHRGQKPQWKPDVIRPSGSLVRRAQGVCGVLYGGLVCQARLPRVFPGGLGGSKDR